MKNSSNISLTDIIDCLREDIVDAWELAYLDQIKQRERSEALCLAKLTDNERLYLSDVALDTLLSDVMRLIEIMRDSVTPS